MARFVCVTCKQRYRRDPSEEPLYCEVCECILDKEYLSLKLLKWVILLGIPVGVVFLLALHFLSSSASLSL